LVAPYGRISVDIRLADRERYLLWRIYDGVLRDIPEAEGREEKCPRCVVSESG